MKSYLINSNDLVFMAHFHSFLSNRRIIVKHRCFESAKFIVPLGVPQGDHLSTLMFNIFINDHPIAVQSSKILLFADDAKIVKIIKSP